MLCGNSSSSHNGRNYWSINLFCKLCHLFLSMSEITKVENVANSPIVVIVGSRPLKLEFGTMEEKNEFYECFPLLKEGIEKV